MWLLHSYVNTITFCHLESESTERLVFIYFLHFPLIARIVGAPQTTCQPIFLRVLCSPLPSGTCRTPGLSIPWCCLPTSSSVCFVFFSLPLCLARWFWPDLMNRRHVHTPSFFMDMSLVVVKCQPMQANKMQKLRTVFPLEVAPVIIAISLPPLCGVCVFAITPSVRP